MYGSQFKPEVNPKGLSGSRHRRMWGVMRRRRRSGGLRRRSMNVGRILRRRSMGSLGIGFQGISRRWGCWVGGDSVWCGWGCSAKPRGNWPSNRYSRKIRIRPISRRFGLGVSSLLRVGSRDKSSQTTSVLIIYVVCWLMISNQSILGCSTNSVKSHLGVLSMNSRQIQ